MSDDRIIDIMARKFDACKSNLRYSMARLPDIAYFARSYLKSVAEEYASYAGRTARFVEKASKYIKDAGMSFVAGVLSAPLDYLALPAVDKNVVGQLVKGVDENGNNVFPGDYKLNPLLYIPGKLAGHYALWSLIPVLPELSLAFGGMTLLLKAYTKRNGSSEATL